MTAPDAPRLFTDIDRDTIPYLRVREFINVARQKLDMSRQGIASVIDDEGVMHVLTEADVESLVEDVGEMQEEIDRLIGELRKAKQPRDERDGYAGTVEYGTLDESTRSLVAAAISHVTTNEVRVAYPDDGEDERDDATKQCVCGDPNCMPYWRPVHEQMNAMRIRADRVSADFTKGLLEQIFELAAELNELRARREDSEAERDADVRAVAELLAIEDEADLPGLAHWGAVNALRDRFADRIAELEARDAKAPTHCICGCELGKPCACEDVDHEPAARDTKAGG